MLVSVYQALQGTNSSAAEISYRLSGELTVSGADGKAMAPVRMEGEMAQSDQNPAAINAALFVGERFTKVYQNALEQPVITGLKLRVEAVPTRRTAVIEGARLARMEARAGEEMEVEATVRPYQAEARVVRMKMTVPAGTQAGPLRVMVSDGATLDRLLQPGAAAPGAARQIGLADTVAQINRTHANDRVYLTVLEAFGAGGAGGGYDGRRAAFDGERARAFEGWAGDPADGRERRRHGVAGGSGGADGIEGAHGDGAVDDRFHLSFGEEKVKVVHVCCSIIGHHEDDQRLGEKDQGQLNE